MLPWAPTADGRLRLGDDDVARQVQVIPAGSFTTLNGQPAYGMGRSWRPTAGANLRGRPGQDPRRRAPTAPSPSSRPTAHAGLRRRATPSARPGARQLEGTFALDPDDRCRSTGVNDCLGDTYDVAPVGTVLYNVSPPARLHRRRRVPRHQPARALAEGRGRSTTTPPTPDDEERRLRLGRHLRATRHANACCTGTRPSPSAPTPPAARRPGRSTPSATTVGRHGGEFPRVNGAAQQGLDRFRTKTGRTAPKLRGPRYTTVPATPTPATNAVSLSRRHGPGLLGLGLGPGRQDAQLRGPAQQQHLGLHAPPATPTSGRCPRMGFIDKGLTPGTQRALPGPDHRPRRQHPVEPGVQHGDGRHRLAERLRQTGHRRRCRATCGGSVSPRAARPSTGPASTTSR